MLRYLFYANAVIGLVLAVLFLFVPDVVASSYSGKMDATAVTLGRYLAAALLPLAYVAWVAAGAKASALKLAVIRVFSVSSLIGLVIAGLAMSASVVSTGGGIFNVALSAIFLIGFGYYGFVKPERGE